MGGFIHILLVVAMMAVLIRDSTAACWGANNSGETSPPEGSLTQASAGLWDTYGMRTDGTVACWGDLVTPNP